MFANIRKIKENYDSNGVTIGNHFSYREFKGGQKREPEHMKFINAVFKI